MGNQNQNGIIIDGNNQPANNSNPTPEKKGLKAFIDNIHRKYDAIRYSKTGKLVAKGLTLIAVGGTAKAYYDKGFKKGQASVTPTVVTIEKIPEGTETPAETPTEEKSEVETAE